MQADIEQRFYDYLVRLGFPEAAIVPQPAFLTTREAGRWRPDYAIIDPSTADVLAVVEIKSEPSPKLLRGGLVQARRYVEALASAGTRAFGATPDTSGEGFTFFSPGEGDRPIAVDPRFLVPDALGSTHRAEAREQVSERRKRTIDVFMVVCFVAAFLSLLIVVLDVCLRAKYKLALLTAERAALLGAALALAIIPFAQKLKMLGVEFERRSRESAG